MAVSEGARANAINSHPVRVRYQSNKLICAHDAHATGVCVYVCVCDIDHRAITCAIAVSLVLLQQLSRRHSHARTLARTHACTQAGRMAPSCSPKVRVLLIRLRMLFAATKQTQQTIRRWTISRSQQRQQQQQQQRQQQRSSIASVQIVSFRFMLAHNALRLAGAVVQRLLEHTHTLISVQCVARACARARIRRYCSGQKLLLRLE